LRFPQRLELELDDHSLPIVLIVPVLDSVDHRLSNRHAHPVHRIFIEATNSSDVVAEELDEVEHVEVAGKLETDQMAGV
jgi:hypothetical protein